MTFLLMGFGVYAQNEAIARQYFEKGDYEKAIVYYEKLHKKNPNHRNYLLALVESYQQTGQFENAEGVLLKALENKRVNPILFIETGYNYQLMKKKSKAEEYYNKALNAIDDNPNFTYGIGKAFKSKSLLEYAIKAYKKGMKLDPKFNFNYDLAYIYGEMGDIENMYDMYLDLMLERTNLTNNIKRSLSRFIGSDTDGSNNLLFKKLLLKRAQANPNILWNELLSWLFIQQKEYKNAFAQEKAIYNRSPESSINSIVDLGGMASEAGDHETAKDIYGFVIENTADQQLIMFSKLKLITFSLSNAKKREYKAINTQFEALLEEYGMTAQTVPIQIAYAKFLAFDMDRSEAGIDMLKEALILPLNRFSKAQIRMNLGDILVYKEQFNQALIFYSQVQKSLKNDVIGQQARFKVAQTSFYKGDFDWAETQLKVLKSSTSQLIANDALELKLLISDNRLQDSTHTALKIYAKADLLAYQEKNEEAIQLLDTILTKHRYEPIEDEALLRQALLYEKEGNYEKAAYNYQKVIEFYPTDILMDDALYHLALLYTDVLEKPEEAKSLLERIIFEHEDSVFFVDARKKYRMLRGDAIN
ncbi:tetratricopeptide repeat protein [Galbibacter sp. EGI 63066]|uniref:tetratricopeptide repeat protein n=1 Tax=Galbibacter sp. EGI 63066 TaxID=2993559 RepID=UPI0022488542|nr:tetratricopeptide repeat protein [Galbibacter sp. EGI 63066]MCX2681110.1 tetratricopeptide repeat protein [Galbibacter sp. EGI 63066]